jgi:hypothetical protein
MGSMKPQPLKGLGSSIRAIASLYRSVVVASELYVCISERVHVRIALRSQRARYSPYYIFLSYDSHEILYKFVEI